MAILSCRGHRKSHRSQTELSVCCSEAPAESCNKQWELSRHFACTPSFTCTSCVVNYCVISHWQLWLRSNMAVIVHLLLAHPRDSNTQVIWSAIISCHPWPPDLPSILRSCLRQLSFWTWPLRGAPSTPAERRWVYGNAWVVAGLSRIIFKCGT